MQIRTVPSRGFTLDYLMWLFTRISGLIIALLSLVGFVSAMIMNARAQIDLPTLMRWTFFPNPNHVVNSNIPDITLGWANAYWQIMEMMIYFFGATHGFNGLRVILEDYMSHTIGRILVRSLVVLLWLFFMFIGVYVILAS